MAINQTLDIRQGQQLTMTPQMQQAIKLLQMTNLEATAYLSQEIEQNPFLDYAQDMRQTDSEKKSDKESDLEDFSEHVPEPELPTAEEGGVDYDSEAPFHVEAAKTQQIDQDKLNYENTLSTDTTLRAHLYDQLNTAFDDPVDLILGTTLIDNISDAGYLNESLQKLSDLLGCTEAELEQILATLQTFDPSGVGARDLAECLRIQLSDQGELNKEFEILLQHIDLLGKHETATLEKKCGVDSDQLRHMLSIIRALNPKPGLNFASDQTQTLIPDIFVRLVPNEGSNETKWTIELNQDTLPKALVNQRYYTEVTANKKDKSEKAFFSEKLQAANWIKRALDQRAQSMIKVSEAIVRTQQPFFEKGVRYLKPLKLKDIASETELHESTISRVTTNKFMATPRGIFELKYFFTSSVAGRSDDDEVSATAVKDAIKRHVDDEDPKKILSDDKLVKLLKSEGIQVARRTVAKYREAMGLGSSVERRRQKQNPLY